MSSNICQDQTSFNNALSIGLDTYRDEQKMSSGTMGIYLLLVLVLFVWALVLAFRLKRGNERLLHILVAMLASPIYIISYYLNCM